MDEIQSNETPQTKSTPSQSTEQRSFNLPNTTKVLVAPEYLTDLFDHLTTNDYPETIRQHLLTHLPRNVYVVHEDDLPERPIDQSLLSQFDSLRQQALQLSKSVQLARSQGFSALCELMAKRTDENKENGFVDTSSIPLSKPSDISPSYHKLAKESAHSLGVLGTRVKKVAEQAADTKKRATRVHQALQILHRNALTEKGNKKEDDTDLNNLISDWGDTFEDIGKIQDQESPHSPVIIPKRKPLDMDDNEVVALSPFITPRSKMRKRMVRSSHQALPRLSFSPADMR